MAAILSDAGYHTVLTGKWHTGEAEGMRPFEVGFDEFQGYYASQKELTQQVDERRYPDLVLNPERLQQFQKASTTVGMYYGAKGKSAAKYQYKDNVVEVDAHVGRIVAALEEAGVADNTFVFFTSDNGPQNDSWPDTGYTPFRGAKNTPWEGGVRVPGIAYWRGMIKRGRESAELFDLMDLFNTSVALAGATDKIPTDRYIDGIDQTAFLLADNGHSKGEKVFIWSQYTPVAMRMYEYKMFTKVMQPQAQWLDIDMATMTDVGLSPWVFNLYIDPKEQYSVGHRLNAWVASLGQEFKAHAAMFKQYPPKDIGLKQ